MPSKAKLTTRSISTSTVTADNLNKGSGLTNVELDSNFLNLRDQTIGIVGDDSTGIDVKAGDTIKIAGTQNITTAVSGDTLTITGPNLSSYATETYVDTAVSNLVDSAPAALDTLNELAAALCDDENFATTITNSLASKVNNTDTGLIVVGDDSTGTSFTVGETVKIAGTGGITTSVTGDTLTVDGSGIIVGGDIGDLTVVGSSIIGPSNAPIIVIPSGTGYITLESNVVKIGQDNTNVLLSSNGRGDIKIRAEDSDEHNPHIIFRRKQSHSQWRYPY